MDESVIGNLKSDRFIVSEFFSQKVLGIFSEKETIELGSIPEHHSRLLRIAPWDGEKPVLTGTDLHFSGGGVEVAEWHANQNNVSGKIDTGWHYPVKLSVAFPSETSKGYFLKTVILSPGQQNFYVSK